MLRKQTAAMVKTAAMVIFSVLFAATILPCHAAEQASQWWGTVKTQAAAEKYEYAVGEPLSVRISVTNSGDEPISYWTVTDNQIELEGTDRDGKFLHGGREPQLSGRSDPIRLAPNENVSDFFYVNKYLKVPGVGEYAVAFSLRLRVSRANDTTALNEFHTINVSGSFTIKIKTVPPDQLEMLLQRYIKQLKSANNLVQRQAAHKLSLADPALAVKLLKGMIFDKEKLRSGSRTYGAWALGKLGTTGARQALIDIAVESENKGARTCAIRELGRWHITESQPQLVALLSDPDANIRAETIRSLGWLGDKESISEIEKKLNDPHRKVRKTAETVLNSIAERARRRESQKRGK